MLAELLGDNAVSRDDNEEITGRGLGAGDLVKNRASAGTEKIRMVHESLMVVLSKVKRGGCCLAVTQFCFEPMTN